MEQVVTEIFQSYYTQTIHKHAIQAIDTGAFDNLNQYGFDHSFKRVLKVI
jgi:ABC-type arginine transport system permease subunit